MRILFVLGGFRVGGYEILSIKIANELAQRSNRIALLSLSRDAHIIEKISAKVETYLAIRYFKFDFSILLRIRKILRNFQPDVIISCSYFEYFIAKFASFLYPRKPQFVLAFHQTQPYDRKEKLWNLIYGSLAKLFDDNYIAIHRSQIDFYCNHYGLPRKRFSLIHNGVDTEYFRPGDKKNGRNGRIFRIVHVANLKLLKDQWTLLKTMVELNKTYKNWELKIVGDDQANILPAYMDFVKQYNIAKKIAFLGVIEDIREVLSNSDVFILTSVTEALPISALEALASGLPCILTNVGGNSDIIDDGKEGFLVQTGDYKTIAQYLKFFIDNPARKKEMGIAARDKAVKQFDFNVMMQKYCDFLYYLLNK